MLQLLYLPECLKWLVSSLNEVVNSFALVMCKRFLVLEEYTCKGCRIYGFYFQSWYWKTEAPLGGVLNPVLIF